MGLCLPARPANGVQHSDGASLPRVQSLLGPHICNHAQGVVFCTCRVVVPRSHRPVSHNRPTSKDASLTCVLSTARRGCYFTRATTMVQQPSRSKLPLCRCLWLRGGLSHTFVSAYLERDQVPNACLSLRKSCALLCNRIQLPSGLLMWLLRWPMLFAAPSWRCVGRPCACSASVWREYD